jgi:thiamine kinase-like enzyme
MHAYADFHASTRGAPMPAWLPHHDTSNLMGSWRSLADLSDVLGSFTALSVARRRAGVRWFRSALPLLREAGETFKHGGPPFSLLHLDTRSDNLRWRHGRLCLFDWPFASVGPAELYVAAFAQSITTEGGPDPDTVVAWYEERSRLRHDLLSAAVASIAAFFMSVAWQPELPDLPRVRAFQRRQLRVSLAWAARLLALPAPRYGIGCQEASAVCAGCG